MFREDSSAIALYPYRLPESDVSGFTMTRAEEISR